MALRGVPFILNILAQCDGNACIKTPEPLSYQLPPSKIAEIWAKIKEIPECLENDREREKEMQTVRASIERIHDDVQWRLLSNLDRRAEMNELTIVNVAQRRNEVFQQLGPFHEATEIAELAFLLYSSSGARSFLNADALAKRFESRFEELARSLFILEDLDHVELEARSHLAFLRRVRQRACSGWTLLINNRL